MAASSIPKFTTLVLMSKTGSGKSSLANALFDTKDFVVGRGFKSQTKECQGQMKFVRGRNLLLVDTPGTMDVKDPSMPEEELLKALNNCPSGVDAFIVMLRGDCRFTDEESRAIQESVDVFGPESCKRAIVVFSHGDHFDNDVKEFNEMLKENRAAVPGLDDLLSKFGNRYVLMDNGRKCDEEFKEQQVAVLLVLVDEVSLLNQKKYQESDLESQTENRNEKKKEAEEKKKAKKEKKKKKEQEAAEMRTEMRDLQRQLADSQRQVQYVPAETRRGYGAVAEFLSDVGGGLGAVAVSPFAGAANLLSRATS